MSLPFLLEIGTEEIPRLDDRPALNNLQDMFQTLLDQHVWAAWSRRWMRRRAGWWCGRGLAGAAGRHRRTGDQGPPKSAGAKAAAGIREEAGTSDALGTHDAKAATTTSLSKQTQGPADDRRFWRRRCPALILKIQWPKTMYWTGKGGRASSVRSVGSWRCWATSHSVRDAGVQSRQRYARAPDAGRRSDPGDDRELRRTSCATNFVILSRRRAARQDRIGRRAALGAQARCRSARNAGLHHRISRRRFAASFDPHYLELPAEVLTTVMRHHQKYFSVEDARRASSRRILSR